MIQFCKTRPDAVIPTKAGPEEVGYDLTIISYVQPVGVNAHMFDTGISLQPPEGYFTMVVPRSSIVKRGVVLTNSVGIIDPTYTGSIKVVLSEVQSGAIDRLRCQLPLALCQLIFFPMTPLFKVLEVQQLQGTTRNDGSFGSTDRK